MLQVYSDWTPTSLVVGIRPRNGYTSGSLYVEGMEASAVGVIEVSHRNPIRNVESEFARVR